MSGEFLRAAFRILHQEGRPLTPLEIVELARKANFLRSAGKTPQNTMRARISDDILANGTTSLFLRTGPNRFGLREWELGEYHARPFRKQLPDEVTVCVPGTIQEHIRQSSAGFFSTSTTALLTFISDRSNHIYVDRRVAETTAKYKQLIAYVWLETEDGLILSYSRGKYSSAHRTLLLGKRSVGFGGHVLRLDAENLFGANDAGLEQAARREIGEELHGVQPISLEVTGVIWDDSSFEGQKHIGVAMLGRLPNSNQIALRSAELSVNGLRLWNRSQLWQSFHLMEFWSQLLIRYHAKEARPSNISTIVPARRPRRMKHIAFVGEIANGKSSIADGVAAALDYSVVSVSAVLRALLNVTDSSEKNRLAFQSVALGFIRTSDGPTELAKAIVANIDSSRTYIIDGVRQLSTLAALRELIPDLTVIYIDSPRDQAFENYRTRDGSSALQFSAVREHEVEAELSQFRFVCDAMLNNADTLENTLGILVSWIEGKSQ
jgi:predicted NUDIX family phosphoesterase/dephospho-CoA kinase